MRLRVAPLVLDLCNQTGITKGLQGKFSVYHGAAVGLVRGKAGIQEYTDAAVNDPAVKRVRELTRATGDSSITEDQAHVTVETVDGAASRCSSRESLGNLHRPLSDAQLEDKFRDQAAVNLPQGVVDTLLGSAGGSIRWTTWAPWSRRPARSSCAGTAGMEGRAGSRR